MSACLDYRNLFISNYNCTCSMPKGSSWFY